jgi:hypothetical protein
MFHNGMSNNDRDFEMCFRVDNVVLPKTGYFGISAATGGLAGSIFFLIFMKAFIFLKYTLCICLRCFDNSTTMYIHT